MTGPDEALALQNMHVQPDCDAPVAATREDVTSVHRRAARYSERMWGFSLCDSLPRKLTNDGVTAVVGDYERMASFIRQQFANFAEESLGSSPSRFVRDTKSEYLRRGCDLVELRQRDETIGLLIGAPEDWSSYYVRVFALRPDFQRPAIARRFARECLFAPLAERGVERIVAETSPANVSMSRILTELRFLVTGNRLSDRWGPMIRYTRFLSPACEAEFRRKFGGLAPAETPRNNKEDE